ncbi:TonB-dependent receptor [Alteraurantiacibacter aquimixticola]|uniref:TonB-dependent receptor n=2 Tax=Alteraurantiacibacter aquimixticola TaxID=2489173 RepID=A0A4T3F5C8_9SPHN|nr:TonB-dependent receptor [Alteraurantiacibacter aquimixticola]
MMALGGMLMSGAAMAQESDEAVDEDTILVTGIRQSLASAQNIKRDSDTVVDAITAEDIGALPDRSVTEALQRVPGIAINRFAGSNDPDHFSVEGSGVVIRGLNFVRSEFNGRTAFAAGVSGQALNFADVPSELLGSVIVSKNATADMIEGGLAGTVNLNTRKPLDQHGLRLGFSAEANYGDFAKEWTPTFSGLISNTWETGAGTFGLLVSGSYSQIRSRADGLQIANYQTRDGQLVDAANTGDRQICRNPLPSGEDNFTLPVGNALCGDFGTAGADGFADYADYRVAPVGGQFRTQDYNRKRDGIAVSAQYETLDGGTTITAEFIRSHSTNAWGEHTYETAPDLSEYSTYPIGCLQNGAGPNVVDSNGVIDPDDETPPRAQCPVGEFTDYLYDGNGLFQSGYIVDASNGWRGAPGDEAYFPIGGSQFSLARRQVHDEITNNDYSLNLDSQLTNRLHLGMDLHYATSRKENLDFSVFGSNFADQELDISGDAPVIIPHKPQFLGYTWSGASDALTNATEAEYFTDPRFQFWRAAMDHAEESTGDQFAIRTDLEYEFGDESFIRSVKGGIRYQDRDQTVRYSTYNWGMLSETWSGARPVNFADTAGDGQQERYEFDNFWRGDVPPPPGAFYYSGDLIDGYDESVAYFQSIQGFYASELGGNGTDWLPLAQREGAIAGTHYLPSDVQQVGQNDLALYGMLRFGTPEYTDGLRVSGNIGLRWVRTRVVSSSSRGPGAQGDLGIDLPFAERCEELEIPAEAGGGTASPGGICNVGQAAYEELQDFVDGSFTPSVIEHDYDYFLPSMNVRFGLTDDIILRLAGSKVLTRPDNGYIRNYFVSSIDTSGNFTGTAGEPTLLPATAWQFDASVEWYFDTVGSLTLNGFYKKINNFFFQEVRQDTIANGSGATREVTVRGPANFDGTGTVKGFEVAYQQTYDFLPGLLSGLGASANYTYIDSSGLPNAFLNGGNVPNDSTIPPGNLPLEQLSKHNINATVFYERGPLSMRAAYNWRSRFLLTASDVIFPYYSIFNDDTGQLDASIFINASEIFDLPGNVRVGVQGVNLLNEVTRTLQAYTGDPDDLAPRSYFMNDRRFSFIIRGQF